MIAIRNIYVTQNGLRDPGQLDRMVSFVKNGGIFDTSSIKEFGGECAKLMHIAEFEDGRLFVVDGHHRLVAMSLGGRNYIHVSECQVRQWKYSDFIEANPSAGWITPFDPRTHLRINQLGEIKRRPDIPYLVPRTIYTVNELISTIL